MKQFMGDKNKLWPNVRALWSTSTVKNQSGCLTLCQGRKNAAHQVAWVSKFCMVAPNVCGSSVWVLLRVTFLAFCIRRWLLDFWKICGHCHISLEFV
jgi:hypothetical protein